MKNDDTSSEKERSIHSSMSDSEKEKIERDNRRVRMRRVKNRRKSVYTEKDNSKYIRKMIQERVESEQEPDKRCPKLKGSQKTPRANAKDT